MHFCELLNGIKDAWRAGADAVPRLSTWLRDAAVQPLLMCVVVAAVLTQQLDCGTRAEEGGGRARAGGCYLLVSRDS